jgi:FMN phosphatase YigB (HAD superfamily)
MPPATAIAAVVFDYAGTLTTPERRRPNGELVRAVLADLGVATDTDFAATFDLTMWRYYTESLPDSVPRLLTETAAHHGVRLPSMGTVLRTLWEACGDHPVDPDAVATVLAQQAAGRMTVLATNTARPGEFRRTTLISAGLQDMLLVASSDIGARKPFRGFYDRVIEETRAPADQIVFVGDNLERDVIEPRNAGMRAVWVNSKHPHHAGPVRMPDGTAVISRLTPDSLAQALA